MVAIRSRASRWGGAADSVEIVFVGVLRERILGSRIQDNAVILDPSAEVGVKVAGVRILILIDWSRFILGDGTAVEGVQLEDIDRAETAALADFRSRLLGKNGWQTRTFAE